MSLKIDLNKEFILMAGPCVIESRDLVLEIASEMKSICERLNIQYVFKASFEKANRTSSSSFVGPGLDKGLKILEEVKKKCDVSLITDVHLPEQTAAAGEVVDILQIPAFLCRQTSLIQAAVKTKRTVQIKKGQFLSPQEMDYVAEKAISFGAKKENIFLCERGVTFGYNNLVVDMRSLEVMKKTGHPVIFDATHSVQRPGLGKGVTSGERCFIPALTRAAAAVGVSGFFMETHPHPEKALSDGPNMVPLNKMSELLEQVVEFSQAYKRTKASTFHL